MAEPVGPQAPLISEGAPDPPGPQDPPASPAPQVLHAPQQPVSHILPLNLSHFKPEFS